jgi:D-tagatose-1,6-bisphosphate aldolase subunit GatZ/KbaZ-like
MSPTPTGVPRLRDLLAADRRGERAGVTSICSAEPFVLEAAANQVNQDGGYTGMTPANFRDAVAELTAAAGLPATSLILGGDHLGPYPCRERPATSAMARHHIAEEGDFHLDRGVAQPDEASLHAGILDTRRVRTRLLKRPRTRGMIPAD